MNLRIEVELAGDFDQDLVFEVLAEFVHDQWPHLSPSVSAFLFDQPEED